LFLLLAVAFASAAFASSSTNAEDKPTVIVVVGAPGEEEYGKNFQKWAGLWEKASRDGGAKYLSIGLTPTNEATDLELLKQTLALEPKESAVGLGVVVSGPGDLEGEDAKVQLGGPVL